MGAARGRWTKLFQLLAVAVVCHVPSSIWSQSSDNFKGKNLHLLSGTWDAHPSLEALLAAPSIPLESDVPSLGNSDEWHWLELDVPSDLMSAKSLEIATSGLDSLVVVMVEGTDVLHRYTAHGGGDRLRGRTGLSATSSFWIGSNYPRFGLPTEPGEEFAVFLGMKSGKQILLPVRVEPEAKFREWSVSRDLFFSMYIGIMLVMLLYNLVLYFSVEDRTYLLYVFFLIGVAGSQLFLEGYQWLIPGFEPTSWWGQRSVHLVGIFSGVTTILFVSRFLDLSKTARNYYFTFNVLLVGYGITLIAVLLGFLNVGFDFINVIAMGAVLALPASIQAWRRGHRSAMFLLIAFTLFFGSVMAFAATQLEVLPVNRFSKFLMPIGSMVEVVLLSIALADRINQLKRDSATAREEQLRVSRLNEKMTREQNEVLEDRVRKRTEELEERNDRLRAALEELKLAQDQLVQSEKLASIGQLTAGIAHELNNPINFVSSSAQSLRRDFDDVTEVLTKLKEVAVEDPSLQLRVSELQGRMNELDLDFTLQEIDELLTGIDDGAARTSEIVKGLRIFSRMDGDAETEANLNDLLESTLVILRSSLREDVALNVDLSPNLPSISCQPGKLNQVFMNVINNAAQAVKKKDMPKEEREVRVRTRVLAEEGKQWVQVAVEDNGVGMTDETRSQIFDPFFTTKEVGEGTGLGLSIVKGILDDHGAMLEIESTLGKGSTFLITFPS